jgi:hypothetical protein
MATLVVGPQTSTCSACGKEADPGEMRHESDPGAAMRAERALARQATRRVQSKGKPAKIALSPDTVADNGCGAPFTSVMSSNGSLGEDRARGMRPDLPYVQVPEIIS